MDVARLLFNFVVNNSDERILLSALMVVESIFEKKLKNLIFRFFQTDMFKIMQNFTKKQFKDEDIGKIVL
jgi:hypothetical protein